MDFIFMLTRQDRTIDDAEEIVDSVCALGVRHIGFKDVGVPRATLERVVRRIRAHGATCYLEVVSTTSDAVQASLEAGAALGVDRILGGTDCTSARAVLGKLDGYFPFPGRPVGHPTKLGGSPDQIERDARSARARGCGGVDLLAYRATEADPNYRVGRAAACAEGGLRELPRQCDSGAPERGRRIRGEVSRAGGAGPGPST